MENYNHQALDLLLLLTRYELDELERKVKRDDWHAHLIAYDILGLISTTRNLAIDLSLKNKAYAFIAERLSEALKDRNRFEASLKEIANIPARQGYMTADEMEEIAARTLKSTKGSNQLKDIK